MPALFGKLESISNVWRVWLDNPVFKEILSKSETDVDLVSTNTLSEFVSGIRIGTLVPDVTKLSVDNS